MIFENKEKRELMESPPKAFLLPQRSTKFMI